MRIYSMTITYILYMRILLYVTIESLKLLGKIVVK